MTVATDLSLPFEAKLEQAAAAKVRSELTAIAVRTDRMFAWLMVLQWLAAIVAALWLSPRTWNGMQSSVHVHVWSAFLLGGVLSGLPIYLAVRHPGLALTRHVIAAAQALWSGLLIHLTGGRIETHFHVFGSLAFLACYRRLSVLLTPTLVVAADHLLRGAFWPESVFGVLTASAWRSAEHAGWVLFEDAFLCWSLRQSRADMQRIALHQVRLERSHELVEREVRLRTRELHDEIAVRIQAEGRLETAHQQLMDAARRAGMAEVATGVLHNVGNVLNSINVSCSLAADRVRKTRTEHLARSIELLEKHAGDLPEFLASDSQGRQLPGFLKLLAAHFEEARRDALVELDALAKRIEHVKKIVASQQQYAKGAGAIEFADIVRSLDEAIALDASSLEKRGIQVVRDYERLGRIELDRQKLLQIMVNLIRNAKESLLESPSNDRRLTLRVRARGEDRFEIAVEDTGSGIPPENLPRIFSHGFTTKPFGHGFGLHSSANVAREMGGSLSAYSEGAGCGATFTLELPCRARASSGEQAAAPDRTEARELVNTG